MTLRSRDMAGKHLRTKAKERIRTRSYHFLPYHPRQLSPCDVYEIEGELDRRLAQLRTRIGAALLPWSAGSKWSELAKDWETCFAIATVLATGWRLANLYDLRIFPNPESLNSTKDRQGFFREGDVICLQIAPRAPGLEEAWIRRELAQADKRKKRQEKPVKPEMTEFLGEDSNDRMRVDPWFERRFHASPCHLDDEARLEIALGGRVSALLELRVNPRGGGQKVFHLPKAELWESVEACLRGRRDDLAAIPRWASRTVEALERYRRQQLIQEENGDPVRAARATGRFENVSAGRYYGTSVFPGRDRHGKPVDVRLGAYRPYDPLSLAHVIETLIERYNAEPSFENLAAYTAVAVSIGLGHRVRSGVIPSTRSIDSESGFCVVHDKFLKKPKRARLVWVPDVIRELIEFYEREVAERGKSGDEISRILLEHIEKGELHFPDPDDPGIVAPLRRVVEAAIASCEPAGHVPSNVGRHWFRTVMSGEVSSATIDAFLGHWNNGNEPWAHGSFLDPLEFRDELQATLPAKLQALGLTSFGEPLPRGRGHSLIVDLEARRRADLGSTYCSIFKSIGPAPIGFPTFQEIRKKLAKRGVPKGAGRMLASAIFNGAFLDLRLLDSWLKAAESPTYEKGLQWVSHNRPQADHRISLVNRWCADKITQRRMTDWSEASRPCITGSAIEELEDYLKRAFQRPLSAVEFTGLAAAYWALRLPSVLLDQALGELPCTQLSDASWRRTIDTRWGGTSGGTSIASDLLETRASQADVLKLFDQSFFHGERAIFEIVAARRSSGDVSEVGTKRLCAELLESWLIKMSAAHERRPEYGGRLQLLRWCIGLLRGGRGQSGAAGLKPYTVKLKLAVAVVEIFGVLRSRFLPEFDVETVEKLAGDALQRTKRKQLVRQVRRDLVAYLQKAERAAEADPLSDPLRDENERLDAGHYKQVEQPSYVSAHVINEHDYQRLLAELSLLPGGRELQIIAILGYRAGLRSWEIMGLRTSDIMATDGRLELQVVHTVQRRLKTLRSTRVLPLNVLLLPEERAALLEWLEDRRTLQRVITQSNDVFRQRRKKSDCASPSTFSSEVLVRELERSSSDRLFGAPYSRALVDTPAIEKKFRDAFTRLGNFHGGCFGWLRHSFASLLLLKLGLPRNALSDLPEALSLGLSRFDLEELRSTFLGKGRLGQSALHAISQCMGHASIGTTLRNYQHLPDLLLRSYVDRTTFEDDLNQLGKDSSRGAKSSSKSFFLANDNQNVRRVSARSPSPGAPVAHRTAASQTVIRFRHSGGFHPSRVANDLSETETAIVREEPPAWQVVLLCLNGETLPPGLLVKHNLTAWRATSWRRKMTGIYGSYFKIEGREFRLAVPQGAMAQFELNRLWRWYTELREPITAGTQAALATLVRNYVGKRSSGRLASSEQFLLVRHFLEASGIDPQTLQATQKDAGYPSVTFRIVKSAADILGQTNDVTRRASRPTVEAPQDKKLHLKQGEERLSKRSEGSPHHRPLVHAYKLFILMVIFCEGAHGKPLPHGNSRRAKALA